MKLKPNLCKTYKPISAHLVHISAVGTVALHAVGAGSALDSMRGVHALHSWVTGVGHTGGTRLHSSHP